HEPAAYITGEREFEGLLFEVGPAVLIPRPETELLVQKAIEVAKGVPAPVLVDAGTGSGAIAVTLAKELPRGVVYATDLSWDALAVARRNAARHGVERRIAFRHGDLLAPLAVYADVIVANLPYVTTADWSALEPE